MFSKKQLVKFGEVDTKNRVLTFKPTYRNVLWITSKDNRAFSAGFLIDLYKGGAVKEGNTQLSDMLKTYIELTQKGYIVNDGLIVTITRKGNRYMFFTNPSLPFWSALVAILVSIVIGYFTCNPSSKESHQEPVKVSLQKELKSTFDSLLYQKKKLNDSLFLDSLNRIKNELILLNEKATSSKKEKTSKKTGK